MVLLTLKNFSHILTFSISIQGCKAKISEVDSSSYAKKLFSHSYILYLYPSRKAKISEVDSSSNAKNFFLHRTWQRSCRSASQQHKLCRFKRCTREYIILKGTMSQKVLEGPPNRYFAIYETSSWKKWEMSFQVNLDEATDPWGVKVICISSKENQKLILIIIRKFTRKGIQQRPCVNVSMLQC